MRAASLILQCALPQNVSVGCTHSATRALIGRLVGHGLGEPVLHRLNGHGFDSGSHFHHLQSPQSGMGSGQVLDG
jgi:hypothetical protein